MTAAIVKKESGNFLSVQKLNCTTSVNKCKFNFLVTLVYRTPKYSTMQRQVFTRQEATSTTLQSSLHATQIVISEKYSLKGMRKAPLALCTIIYSIKIVYLFINITISLYSIKDLQAWQV